MPVMALDIFPATADRFDDVVTILGPKDPDGQACWCLTYRVAPAVNGALDTHGRRELVRSLCGAELPPGVLAYEGETVVGWAGVAPRSDLHAFTRTTRIPVVDDLPVWTVWCFRVRAGHRRKGVAQALLDGAVRFALEHGAPAVEGYPVDNDGARIDATLAYVGTRAMFERAGFTKAADTTSVSARTPRVVMRRLLDDGLSDPATG